MEKIKYAVIGSGWRAEFYMRIAKAVPNRFDLKAILTRDIEKARKLSEKYNVKVVNTIDELMEEHPEFVVLAIKRGTVTDYLLKLFEKKIPVLTETPPGESPEDLMRLWNAFEKYQPKVQVAEQYYLQPLYKSWHKAIEMGLIGNVENISISSLHGYHGMSIVRWMLGTKGECCAMHGKRYHFSVTDTYGRDGMIFDGNTFICPQDRVVLEFDKGQVAFFNFSDPAQYHSFIRTRQLTIQGERGEIDDLRIRYLTADNIPVTQDLNRVDLGVYGNQEWSHFAILLGEKFLYKTPFINARLNDDEIAVGSLLLGMDEYLKSGKDVYSLADALQDMYLCLKMEEAMAVPYKEIRTEKQPWDYALKM